MTIEKDKSTSTYTHNLAYNLKAAECVFLKEIKEFSIECLHKQTDCEWSYHGDPFDFRTRNYSEFEEAVAFTIKHKESEEQHSFVTWVASTSDGKKLPRVKCYKNNTLTQTFRYDDNDCVDSIAGDIIKYILK